MLLGKRVSLGVKVFLTALAVVDDLGAVVVIAIFYTSELHLGSLLGGLGLLALLALLARAGARHPLIFAGIGLVVWVLFLRSGVHATVAGVLTALTVPHRVRDGDSPLAHWEHALAPLVTYLVMPVFALANAGVVITGEPSRALHPVPLGIILGLFLGKPIGIFLFSWIAVKLRAAALPQSVNWRAIYGAATLGGIGFTMSLFIATLAFGLEGGENLEEAKVGILTGSLLSAVAGTCLLLASGRTVSADATSESP
jgi:NhaA family Na+:H+ antiporter